jgi:hypothetical protein
MQASATKPSFGIRPTLAARQYGNLAEYTRCQQRMPSAGNANCCARSDMEQAQLNWIANFISGIAISLTRYFYKPRELRTLDQIRCDILAPEKETDGLLGEIIGGARS